MFDANLTDSLTSEEPRARLSALVGLYDTLSDELAGGIAKLVEMAFPSAAEASWQVQFHFDDQGGYFPVVQSLAITLTNGTNLYPPTDIDEWDVAIDLQRSHFTRDSRVLAVLDAIADHDGYVAWLTERAGIEGDLLNQIAESVLVYAYATRSDGSLEWRPIVEHSRPEPGTASAPALPEVRNESIHTDEEA
jgi:hypothetical protein